MFVRKTLKCFLLFNSQNTEIKNRPHPHLYVPLSEDEHSVVPNVFILDRLILWTGDIEKEIRMQVSL